MREWQLKVWKENLKHWRLMALLYLFLALLDIVLVVLHCISIAAAVAAGTFVWTMIVSPILWFVCVVSYIFLATMAIKEWHGLHNKIKELDNE